MCTYSNQHYHCHGDDPQRPHKDPHGSARNRRLPLPNSAGCFWMPLAPTRALTLSHTHITCEPGAVDKGLQAAVGGAPLIWRVPTQAPRCSPSITAVGQENADSAQATMTVLQAELPILRQSGGMSARSASLPKQKMKASNATPEKGPCDTKGHLTRLQNKTL